MALKGNQSKIDADGDGKITGKDFEKLRGGPQMKSVKISPACKALAKKKFKVWPSAYASAFGVKCTKAGGPGKMNKKKK
jgi:hypothetical protein